MSYDDFYSTDCNCREAFFGALRNDENPYEYGEVCSDCKHYVDCNDGSCSVEAHEAMQCGCHDDELCPECSHGPSCSDRVCQDRFHCDCRSLDTCLECDHGSDCISSECDDPIHCCDKVTVCEYCDHDLSCMEQPCKKGHHYELGEEEIPGDTDVLNTPEVQNSYRRNSGQRWSLGEDEYLCEAYLNGEPLDDIAHFLERTPLAIRARVVKLTLGDDVKPFRVTDALHDVETWDSEEVEFLRFLISREKPLDEIASKLEKDVDSVARKLVEERMITPQPMQPTQYPVLPNYEKLMALSWTQASQRLLNGLKAGSVTMAAVCSQVGTTPLSVLARLSHDGELGAINWNAVLGKRKTDQ